MTVYYILYFAGVAVALLLYILNLRLTFKVALKEVPSLASKIGTKEQQNRAIIISILTEPLAYWFSWISVLVHIVELVDHGIWAYKQHRKKATDEQDRAESL